MLWLRIIDLKHKNSELLTVEEDEVWNRTHTTSFSVPEPILLQLRQVGNITVKHLNQHLYPTFPQLPTWVIAGHGGYYGELVAPAIDTNDSIHNLYEEIPCLGVMSEAIRAAKRNAPPGPYQSAITYQGLQPNRNLLGFKPLGSRRNEPKNLAFSNNITEVDFDSNPPNTSFNFNFLIAMSSLLSTTKTFKITNTLISSLPITGSTSQLVISAPEMQQGVTCLQGVQRHSSFVKDSLAVYGFSVFYNSQLIKEDYPNGSTDSWCLISPGAGIPIPDEWIENKNERRDLPDPFFHETYTLRNHSIHPTIGLKHYET